MGLPGLRFCALLLAFVALTSVTGQTFQYSRGWTNGKRDGHKRSDDVREIASSLERILNPCQIKKLKYILEGKPFNDRLLMSCVDYLEDENDIPPKRTYSKGERNQDIFDALL